MNSLLLTVILENDEPHCCLLPNELKFAGISLNSGFFLVVAHYYLNQTFYNSLIKYLIYYTRNKNTFNNKSILHSIFLFDDEGSVLLNCFSLHDFKVSFNDFCLDDHCFIKRGSLLLSKNFF